MKSTRPKLPRVSEQMKIWSAALSTEAGNWPQVTRRSFFGFTALYRRDKIFALLPRTRAMETPNALAFKLDSPSARMNALLRHDPRIGSTQMQKARWFTFEMSCDTDLRAAIEWLDRAYRKSGRRGNMVET
ncbi:MAG: hypothetical protein WAN65_32885 [Candidatus Sulfotelmatobacter sp.]